MTVESLMRAAATFRANGFKLMGTLVILATLWIHNDFIGGLDLSILDEVS
jgi:hypothetical protein